MTLEISPRLEIRTQASASTIVSATVLAMPVLDLRANVVTAAQDNPALLVRERPVCHKCFRALAAGTCLRCGGSSARSLTVEPTASVSAWEQLRSDALAIAPRGLADVVTAVLAALDDHGFLPIAARDALKGNGVDPIVLARAVQAVQEVGPPGIAAVDAAESLVLQLDSAPLEHAQRELARRLLTIHTELIENGQLDLVARLENCSIDAVQSVLSRMRRLLRPYPGFGEPRFEAAPIPPDLVFEPDGGRVRARVTEKDTLELGLDPDYVEVAAEDKAGLDTVRAQLRDADTMIRRIHRRWSMLQALGDLLADHHADRLLAGSPVFRSLTQSQAAQSLDVHESTISRAVANRCARLVNGEVVPLRRMFGANNDVRAAVAELCATVPRPSDREIAELLAARGIVVSRRAVNKYRRS